MDEQQATTESTPWATEEAYPPKPEGHPYGYCTGARQVPCSVTEVIRHCSRDEIPKVTLVWTPHTERCVPPEQVEFLRSALHKREKSSDRQTFFIGLFATAFLGLRAYGADGPRAKLMWGALALLGGILPVATVVWGWFADRRAPANPSPATKEGAADREQQRAAEKWSRFLAWSTTRRHPLVWLMVLLVVAMSILQMTTGLSDSVQAAGMVKDKVRAGEWWRLVTAGLLHAGFMHLWFNVLALWVLMRFACSLTHWSRALTAFLAGVVAGNLTSLALMPHTDSIGASTGLLGLLGLLLVAGYRQRQNLPLGFFRHWVHNLIFIAVIGIVGFFFIDNAGHMGGLVGGLAAGMLSVPRRPVALPLRPTRWGLALGFASSGVMLWAAWLAFHKITTWTA